MSISKEMWKQGHGWPSHDDDDEQMSMPPEALSFVHRITEQSFVWVGRVE